MIASLLLLLGTQAAPQGVDKKDLLGCRQRVDESADQRMRFKPTRGVRLGKD